MYLMQVEMYAVLKLKTSSGFGHVEVGVGANTAREERVCVWRYWWRPQHRA